MSYGLSDLKSDIDFMQRELEELAPYPEARRLADGRWVLDALQVEDCDVVMLSPSDDAVHVTLGKKIGETIVWHPRVKGATTRFIDDPRVVAWAKSGYTSR